MSDMDVACVNADRELYREPDETGNGGYYSNSLHVTQDGGVGINVSGLVFVKPLAEWHRLAKENSMPPNSVFTQKESSE
jgi:hypothetical protein